MKTSTDKKNTNYTFHRVASFCGLRISLYATELLLAVSFLGLVLTENRTASPLYILLSVAIAPGLLRAMFGPESEKKRENDLPFPLFRKKYHYNTDVHKALNITYLLLFLMLGAWHISYRPVTGIPAFIMAIPTGTAALSMIIRVIVTIGYRIYFRYFPLKAMH